MCLAGALAGGSALGDEPRSDMEDVGKRIGKHISKAGFSSTAVADFVREDGTALAVGRYFAQEVTQSLKHNHPKIMVVDPWHLLTALTDAEVSPKELLNIPDTEKLRNVVHVDSIITGTVEMAADHYNVKVTARSMKDGTVISLHTKFVRRPSYTDAQMFLDPTAAAQRIDRVGEGVTGPMCIECTTPALSKGESKPKQDAEVELDIIISEEGTVLKAAVIKSSNSGLTNKALEAVKKWRFKPATDKNGKPMVAIVPVKVTFRTY